MKETLLTLRAFWYENIDMFTWNGLTVSFAIYWATFLAVVIYCSWNDSQDFSYSNWGETKESIFNLIIGWCVFTLVAVVFWVAAPLILPIMFIVGVSMITTFLGKTLAYKQEQKSR